MRCRFESAATCTLMRAAGLFLIIMAGLMVYGTPGT